MIDITSSEWLAYKNIRAPYTCIQCGHKVGLSFIEKRHNCKHPMFDKEGNLPNDPIMFQPL